MKNEKKSWWETSIHAINIFKTKIEKSQQEVFDRHKAIKELYAKSPFQGVTGINELQAKNLVLVDLFVQKDVRALEKRAFWFQIIGILLYLVTLSVFSLAVIISLDTLLNKERDKHIIDIKESFYLIDWSVPIQNFIISFTVYGLLILLGVTAWKHGKAYFDQAERLYAKRRTNRFLRLYIHLNHGKLTLDELVSILELADNKNAFTDIKAEAKAPWGNVINELIQSNTEIVKSMTKGTKDLTVKNKLFDYKRH